MASKIIVFLGVLLAILLAGGIVFFAHSKQQEPKVSPIASITPSETPVTTVTLTPTPTAKPVVHTSKKNYLIALYGDSMIDTMSDYADLLPQSLAQKYPGVTFTIDNYGIGAQNIEDGLKRWDQPFSNRGRTYPAITQIHPDVIIVGSFSYNPFNPFDSARHKQLLKQLVEKAKEVTPNVYVLAEIAPLGPDFGDGPKGVNWTDEQSTEQSLHIISQIHNAFEVSQEEQVTIVNAFDGSKSPGSDFGRRQYVNPDDGIHPSYTGHAYVANTIVSALTLK